jgi:hypothetical protein
VKVDIVDLAYQILEMKEIINEQAREIDHLRKFKDDYFELCDRSHNETNKMVGIVLKGLLNQTIKPGFVLGKQTL